MSETPLAALAVYSARPTIRVDGQENEMVNGLLSAMQLTESEGGMCDLSLRFSNVASNRFGGADLAFENESVLKLGASITVYGGDENSPQELFRGRVTGLEAEFSQVAAPELIVLAEDALQRARMARRSAVYEDLSLADLAKLIAARLGLTPQITGFTERIGTRVQLNESDLAFLRRLLVRHDGDLQMVGTELHVSPRDEVRRGVIDLEMYSQLRAARVLADLAHQTTRVTTAGWDALRGRPVSGSSTGAHAGPGQGRTGAQLLEQVLGERVEHLGRLAVTTTAEAEMLADAAFDQRARRFVRLHGTAEGNPACASAATCG
jgi:uncharacterized protein